MIYRVLALISHGYGAADSVKVVAVNLSSFHHCQQSRLMFRPFHRPKEYRAAFYGHTAAVRLLLENGADIEARDAKGETALVHATQRGHTGVVHLLLEKGAKIKKSTVDSIALIKAVRKDCTDEVRLLLENGADVNARSNLGKTALMEAVLWYDTFRLLLDKGADINAKSINSPNGNTEGYTALILAVCVGKIDVLHLLLEKGANIGARDAEGRPALIHAAYAPPPERNIDIVRLLLDKGADIGARDAKGRTALMYAVSGGRINNVGAKTPDWTTWRGEFPPYYCDPDMDIVRLLLDKGADIGARDAEGRTALMYAVHDNDYSTINTVRLLLEKGVDVNIKSIDGGTALMYAEKNGYNGIVKLLKKAGAKE